MFPSSVSTFSSTLPIIAFVELSLELQELLVALLGVGGVITSILGEPRGDTGDSMLFFALDPRDSIGEA